MIILLIKRIELVKRRRLSLKEKYEIFKEIKEGALKEYIIQKHNLKPLY